MKALQYCYTEKGPEVAEIDKPEPTAGKIRLKVTAAGLCHSDS
jgi:propanol-preferring alcohol dehydrogenase